MRLKEDRDCRITLAALMKLSSRNSPEFADVLKINFSSIYDDNIPIPFRGNVRRLWPWAYYAFMRHVFHISRKAVGSSPYK